MISMSLLSVVLVAFAAVFPGGYRVNLQNLNQGKATGYASGIIEQLSNQTVTILHPLESANATLKVESQNFFVPPSGLIVGSTPPTAPNVFFLQNISIVNSDAVDDSQAITDLATFGTPAQQAANIPSQIFGEQVAVTITWLETRRNHTMVNRSVTETTLITSAIAK